MRKNWKKRIALLLAASMVFSMNTVAFADEVVGDEAEGIAVEEASEVAEEVAGEEVAGEEVAGAEEVVGADEEVAGAEDEVVGAEDEVVGAEEVAGAEVAAAEADASIQDEEKSVSTNAVSQNYYLLSENAATISENLTFESWVDIGDYIIVYPTALAYAGKKSIKDWAKNEAKGDIYVYKDNASVSAGVIARNLLSENAADREKNMTASFNAPLAIKSVKIKASKGATVDIEGWGIVPIKNTTYISAIKFTDKTIDKPFKTAMKTYVDAIKKNKTGYVSANGYTDTSLKTFQPLTIAVYPAFAYTSAATNADVTELLKESQLNSCAITVVPNSKDASIIKKATGELGGKVTLKATTKADKPKGLVSGKKAKGTAELGTTSTTPTGKYMQETNGNFFGWLSY